MAGRPFLTVLFFCFLSSPALRRKGIWRIRNQFEIRRVHRRNNQMFAGKQTVLPESFENSCVTPFQESAGVQN